MTDAIQNAREALKHLKRAADEMRAEDVNGWPVACDHAAEVITDLLTALDAETEVKVRELEWREEYDEFDTCALASTPVRYEIFHQAIDVAERGFMLCVNEKVSDFHPSIEAAKAAAQADYERRIRSALVPPESRS